MSELIHPNDSPFYEWLDHARIRDLVHAALALSPGERLVLVKGLVPGLVQSLGIAEFEEFCAELALKGRRFEEARTHPGEGRATRVTPGELIGGPLPEGHVHVARPREPDRAGAREVEREAERALWDSTTPEQASS